MPASCQVERVLRKMVSKVPAKIRYTDGIQYALLIQ